MNTFSSNKILSSPQLSSGFSLVEMMLSITIGLMIIAALSGVLISNANSSKTNDRTAELQSNGRFALSHLQAELRLAGYRGYTPRAPESTAWTTPTINNECGTAGAFVKNIRQSVWGADNNPFATSCISTGYNDTSNSDVLVIRHVAEQPTLAASAVSTAPNMVFLRTSYNNAAVMKGDSLPTEVIGTDNFELKNFVYYIGSDDANANNPALRRVALTSICTGGITPPCMIDEMVVSGIEQLQVQYGVANGANIQYFNAGAITGGHSATAATDWDKVTAVRIWLLARNSRVENGYTNNNTYTMGDIVYTPPAGTESIRRQLFTTVIQLRNFRN